MEQHVLAWIAQYGYLAIFSLLVLGIVGLPVPDETLLTFTGYLVFRGHLWLPLAFLSAFQVFLPRENKHRYYLDHRGDLFYIRTNKGGHNFEVVTAPEKDHAPANWKVLVPHSADVRIQDIDLFRDFAVVVEKTQAIDRIRVYDFGTHNWTAIEFPEPVYAAYPGETPYH